MKVTNNYRWLILCLVCSLISNLFIGIQGISIRQKYIKMQDLELELKTNIDNLKEVKLLELASSGLQFPRSTVVIDQLGNELLLSDVVGNGKLVFRFSETHCSACIDMTFELLKEIENKNPDAQIIIVTSVRNARTLKVVKETYDVRSDFFNMSVYDSVIPMDAISTPYFFTIDESLLCSDFFAVFKESPEYSFRLIEESTKRFFHRHKR